MICIAFCPDLTKSRMDKKTIYEIKLNLKHPCSILIKLQKTIKECSLFVIKDIRKGKFQWYYNKEKRKRSFELNITIKYVIYQHTLISIFSIISSCAGRKR
jgi:hypothetical protein